MHTGNVDEQFALALRHHQSGQLAEAEHRYRQILQADPNHSDALHFLGVVAFQTGNLEPALELIQRSVSMRPDGAVYRNNLGQVLERMERCEDAEQAYRLAIKLDSQYAEPCNNLGRLLQNRESLSEAEDLYRRAIRLNPHYAEPHTNLGNLYKDRGELDAAIGFYRRGIELSPGLSFLHSNLLLTLHYHPEYSPDDLAREHSIWADRHVAPLAATRSRHENEPDPQRRLRLGYVSPDFREHAVARFISPVLEHHDPQAVEVYAYADVARQDNVTQSLRAQVHHWRDIDALSDEQLAARVRNDQIDILVDLAAHSGRNRLLSFARKPAPVQVTWLAYCSTTGVDAIDYRLTDRFLDPPDAELNPYTEESVYLPNCYWCYSAPKLPKERAPACERQPGPLTFGSLNNFAKVTQPTLSLWMKLLRQVPESRLLLYAPPGSHRERVRNALQNMDLNEDRVRFVSRQPFEDYLRTWCDVDVALDPFPYGGGTTTCDALWMGVPVVSLAGRTAVSRSGSSILSNIGLERFVTRSENEYLERAATLIRDQQMLTQLRRGLRERLESSPIMNARQFTRDLEAAFRDMWRSWCNSQS
jgi:predicted O-linked N-acetylglucosamine transferase (SPINDLY family)